jgi:hypothetical protein
VTERANGGALSVYDNALKQGQRSVAAVTKHTKAQPVSSLLIAFGAGFIFSKLISR